MALSSYDKKYMSQADQDLVADITAKVQSGAISLDQGHQDVEALRNKYGYSGGEDGSAYNSTASSGNTASPYAGTDYHQEMINAARDYAKAQSSGGSGNWGAVLDAMNKRDEKISTIGTDGGRSSNDILQELYSLYYEPYTDKTPQWEGSQYDSYMDSAVQKLLGMNYDDWVQTDQYKALLDRYSGYGQQSMKDTLGQVSSRTGGLASSYATTAAQQQYNDYMTKLEDVARSMYDAERGDLQENAQLAQSMADRDYNRYLDSLSQANTDRSYQYQLDRDAISDSRYDQEYADSTAAERKSDAQSRINAFLAAGGSLSALDQSLIDDSGLTQAELDVLAAYYTAQLTPTSSSGGSYRSTGSDTSEGSDKYVALANMLGYQMNNTATMKTGVATSYSAFKDSVNNAYNRGEITKTEKNDLLDNAKLVKYWGIE